MGSKLMARLAGVSGLAWHTSSDRRSLAARSPWRHLRRAMASERSAIVKNADMSEDVQQDAVDTAVQAMEKFSIEREVRPFAEAQAQAAALLRCRRGPSPPQPPRRGEDKRGGGGASSGCSTRCNAPHAPWQAAGMGAFSVGDGCSGSAIRFELRLPVALALCLRRPAPGAHAPFTVRKHGMLDWPHRVRCSR